MPKYKAEDKTKQELTRTLGGVESSSVNIFCDLFTIFALH